MSTDVCATELCFNLAIDSKLRGCDIVKIKIGGPATGASIRNRATVIQQKTGKPVQFELMAGRATDLAMLARTSPGARQVSFVFPSRVDYLGHLSTRQ